jgi:hypothetical protein
MQMSATKTFRHGQILRLIAHWVETGALEGEAPLGEPGKANPCS